MALVRWRTIAVAGLMCVAGLTQAAHASAQAAVATESAPDDQAEKDREARLMFEAGRSAYDAGRFTDALKSFQRAYELSQRPALLYNLGQAADRLREDEIALDAFERFVQAVPNSEIRPAVEERIRVLRGVLAEKQAAAQNAVSPVQVAQAAQPAPSTAAPATKDDAPRDDDGSVLSKWWLWAGAGGVVAAVVITALVVSSGGGGGSGGELVKGSDGKVIFAAGLHR